MKLKKSLGVISFVYPDKAMPPDITRMASQIPNISAKRPLVAKSAAPVTLPFLQVAIEDFPILLIVKVAFDKGLPAREVFLDARGGVAQFVGEVPDGARRIAFAVTVKDDGIVVRIAV
jgi:hypothetical protein